MKRTSILRCGADQLAALGPAAIALGEAEGLSAHARSVAIRLTAMSAAPSAGDRRLVKLTLDEESIGQSNPDVEHERAVRDLRPAGGEFLRAGRP